MELQSLPPEQFGPILLYLVLEDLVSLLAVSRAIREMARLCVTELPGQDYISSRVLQLFPLLRRVRGEIRVRDPDEVMSISARIQGDLRLQEESPYTTRTQETALWRQRVSDFQLLYLKVLLSRATKYPHSTFQGNNVIRTHLVSSQRTCHFFQIFYNSKSGCCTFHILESQFSRPIFRYLLIAFRSLRVTALHLLLPKSIHISDKGTAFMSELSEAMTHLPLYALMLKDSSTLSILTRYANNRRSRGLPVLLQTLHFATSESREIIIRNLRESLAFLSSPIPSVRRVVRLDLSDQGIRNEALALFPNITAQ